MPLTNMRGVTVNVARVRTTDVVNAVNGSSIRLIVRLGSIEMRGVTCTRAVLTAIERRSPP